MRGETAQNVKQLNTQ